MSTKWTATRKCGKQEQETCCEQECTSGTRNRYFTGKRLTPDALSVEQEYVVERRRLINRAMHGWGVVYGYPVTLSGDTKCGDQIRNGVALGAGLAFDRMGRELVQTAQEIITLDDILELQGDDSEGDSYLLRVHYAERLIDPLIVKDSCSCERQQWDHICETVRYSLQKVAAGACCDPQPCGLECECETCSDCGGQLTADDPRAGAFPCICRHLTSLAPGADCHHLAEVSERLRVDLHNGVPLACVTLGQDECGEWRITAVTDACGPRRLVKRNDLLFDLIRGCDLTRISSISWAAWHRAPDPVPWTDFDAFFAATRSDRNNCVTRFSVDFSRPVLRDTLNVDCFAMTFLIRQREGGWLLPVRAPIVKVLHEELSGGGQQLAQRAVLVVSWGWVADALRSHETEFERGGAMVEIEIKGDYILDCNGQPVDAEARGRSPAPSGNGSPGGTFRSNFVLGAKPEPTDTDSSSGTDTIKGGIQS